MCADRFVFCAVAALLELDAVYVGQFMLSRPTVAGALLGFMGGDFWAGLQIGLFTELLFMDHIPVGGNVPPSGVYAVACAISLSCYYGLDRPAAFVFGIVAGKAYSVLEAWLRGLRSGWNSRVESEIETRPAAINGWIAKALGQEFAAGFIYLIVIITVFGLVGQFVQEIMPHPVAVAVLIGYYAVPWMGLATLVANLYAK